MEGQQPQAIGEDEVMMVLGQLYLQLHVARKMIAQLEQENTNLKKVIPQPDTGEK
jgi:hypothetical protein